MGSSCIAKLPVFFLFFPILLYLQLAYAMPHQDHKRVHEDACAEGYIDLFTIGRHNPEHLLDRLTSFAARREGNFSKLQQIALDHINGDPLFTREAITNLPAATLRVGPKKSKAEGIEGTSDRDIIVKYFSFFNKMFFFGALRRVEIVLEVEDYKQAPAKGILGKLKKETPKTPQIRLRRRHTRSREEDLQAYISMLLHDMIHVFFELYTCRCSSPYWFTGHNASWIYVATALERACAELGVLAFDVDLERALSCALSVEGWPSEHEFKDWGLTEADMHRAYKNVRSGFRPCRR